MPNFSTVSHIDLSVSNVEKSADWYCEVMGLRRLRRAEFDNRVMIVLRHDATGLIIGLNQHSTATINRFDERNIGLDHVGFGVAERDELEAWEARLASLDVAHSAVTDTASGTALVFRDPDNIQLEFWWTRPS